MLGDCDVGGGQGSVDCDLVSVCVGLTVDDYADAIGEVECVGVGYDDNLRYGPGAACVF